MTNADTKILAEIVNKYNEQLKQLTDNLNDELRAIIPDAMRNNCLPYRVQYDVDKPSDDCVLDFHDDGLKCDFYHKFVDGVEFVEVVDRPTPKSVFEEE